MGLAATLLPYGAALVAIALLAAYLFTSRKFDHWARKGVPHEAPLPFVGGLKDVVLARTSMGLLASDVYARRKREPFVGFFAFDAPVLLVHDLQLVKAVLVKDSQWFMDRTTATDEVVDPLPAKSLFGLKGERWKQSRTAITPSFTSGKMKRMFEFVSECGQLLVEVIHKEKLTEKPVSVYELATRYTCDVIATCAFGIEGNTLADPEAQFRKTLTKHFEFSGTRAIALVGAFFAPKLFKLLGFKILLPEVENFIRNTITSTVKEREKQNLKRDDLLDSLMQLKNAGSISDADEHKDTTPSSNKIAIDYEDICGHSFAFLVAGYETSASTIRYLLYELAKNQDVQEKLCKEIQEASIDGVFTYEILQGMKYMDMVVKETLRMYPPLPFIERRVNGAYTLPGYNVTVEEGTTVMVPIYAFHMDPEYHPNPKQFNPERFSDENKNKIINYTYMPFGEGPRSCVGMRFALMQTKSAIAHLLLKFSVHPSATTPKEIIFNPRIIFLQPKDKIELILRPF